MTRASSAGSRSGSPEVRVHRPSEPLEELSGAVVVLDVFRASNTILSLLAAGAAEVLLVADLARARRLKAQDPRRLLLGERGGLAPPDFDGGNSPVAAAELDVRGRAVVLSTSAGTQAVHRLGRADAVLVGSFANAGAVCRRLAELRPDRVGLLPMGLEARRPAVEDDEAARYLRARLGDEHPSFEVVRRRLLSSPGADRLRRLDQGADLRFCTRLDSHRQVPAVVQGDPPCALLS